MKVMILGADGYLGWPTCMHLSEQGHDVVAVDSYQKKHMMENLGVWYSERELLPARCSLWESLTQKHIRCKIMDVCRWEIVSLILDYGPDVIIHYAEQPSAPYSMHDSIRCMETFNNNINSTLNILWAIKGMDTHLIKLGTMGEYGTPETYIEEGWVDLPKIEEPYKSVKLPFPKQPGSFYHASKVADSVVLEFACRNWGIRCTDLNQGVVYGVKTDEMKRGEGLETAFYYDSIFGTALNRFIAQAVTGNPITVYGKGGQTRGWLNIKDTMQCVRLALENPPEPGEFRVLNQFTEIFSVLELAEKVHNVIGGEIKLIDNPRKEKEKHKYKASNSGLRSLGMQPEKLTDKIIEEIAQEVENRADTIKKENLYIKVNWR